MLFQKLIVRDELIFEQLSDILMTEGVLCKNIRFKSIPKY